MPKPGTEHVYANHAMNNSLVSLGYIILYVRDVAKALAFYEAAFGLTKRFFHEEGGDAYGELETGATRLAFASYSLAKAHLSSEIIRASPDQPPLGAEIALTTVDVPVLYSRAVKAGATEISAPAKKPWGQTVSYLRDPEGHLIELCTPMP